MYEKNIPYKKMLNIYTKIGDCCYEYSPLYKGMKVIKEFKTMNQTIAWCYRNYYEIGDELMCFDYSLLSDGSNVFKYNTCCFLPKSIQQFLVKINDFKIEYKPSRKSYKATLMIKGKLYAKEFKGKLTATKWVKRQKENYLKEFANNNKEILPTNVYEALANYKIVSKQ